MDEADRECLADMLRYAEIAVNVLASSDLADLAPGSASLLALLHAVQTIGEAANHVSAEVRINMPEIPWADVIGMRHRLIHDYRRTRAEVVIKTVRNDVPELISLLRRALEENEQ